MHLYILSSEDDKLGPVGKTLAGNMPRLTGTNLAAELELKDFALEPKSCSLGIWTFEG